MGLNVLVIGLTNFLFSRLLSPDPETWNSPGRFLRMKIPVLGDIPVIGPVLFDQNVIVYFLYLIVIVVHVALFRSRWGLRVRAVGEHPEAADTAGINVERLRVVNVTMAGALAGCAGVYLSMDASSSFERNIVLPKGVDVDAISATVDHGVLEVTVPHPAEEQPRQINVTTTSDASDAASNPTVDVQDQQTTS